jgi:hypothetical protein
MPKMPPHTTYVHGSRREGYWWGCADGCNPPNSFVYRHDAEREAQKHKASTPQEKTMASQNEEFLTAAKTALAEGITAYRKDRAAATDMCDGTFVHGFGTVLMREVKHGISNVNNLAVTTAIACHRIAELEDALHKTAMLLHDYHRNFLIETFEQCANPDCARLRELLP